VGVVLVERRKRGKRKKRNEKEMRKEFKRWVMTAIFYLDGGPPGSLLHGSRGRI
jgi:hypothetical protein